MSHARSSSTAGRLAGIALAATVLVGLVLWLNSSQAAQSDATPNAPQPGVNVPGKTEPSSFSNAPADKAGPVTTVAPQRPTLAGTWRDETYPNVVDQVTQDGQSFRFVRRGMLLNGVLFESTGEGRIDGTRVSHRYQAQYQGGAFSSGACSGNLTTDGSRIVLQCSDSLLGQFPAVMVRQ